MQNDNLPIENCEKENSLLRQLIEQENAFLNPEEWGVLIDQVVEKQLCPIKDLKVIDDYKVQYYLPRLVLLLAQHHLCLTSSNHLSDRELYQHILENILPKPIGIGPNPEGGILYHECCSCDDSEKWLAYYASEGDRQLWKDDFDEALPEKKDCVSDRDMWLEILAESFRDEPLPVYEEESQVDSKAGH